jgi:hypothetical protein
MLVQAVREYFTSQKSENWPSVEGRITETEIKGIGPSGERAYYPKVSYTYSVLGQAYTGDIRSGTREAYSSREEARLRMPYQPDAPVKVYYNPENPAKATLEVGTEATHGTQRSFFLAIFVIALGVLMLYMSIRYPGSLNGDIEDIHDLHMGW